MGIFSFSFWFIFLHAYKHGAGGFSYKSMQTLREPSPQAISVVNSVKLRKQNIFRKIMEEGHQIHLRHCLIHLRANGCGSQSCLSNDGWLKNVPSHLRHSQSLCFSFLWSFILSPGHNLPLAYHPCPKPVKYSLYATVFTLPPVYTWSRSDQKWNHRKPPPRVLGKQS